MKLKSVNARIKGKVQGVWHRGWTVQAASALGLTGWVRNRQDGTVEAVISGPSDVVDEMLVKCHEGPEFARVSTVIDRPCEAPTHTGFEKRPTV